jgi:Skp family chaperone for outer membrane proteins
MKNLIADLFVTGFLFISTTSFSQNQLKIGHVNFDEIMQALHERDSAQAVLEKGYAYLLYCLYQMPFCLSFNHRSEVIALA